MGPVGSQPAPIAPRRRRSWCARDSPGAASLISLNRRLQISTGGARTSEICAASTATATTAARTRCMCELRDEERVVDLRWQGGGGMRRATGCRRGGGGVEGVRKRRCRQGQRVVSVCGAGEGCGRRGRRGSGLIGSTQRDRVHRGRKERYGGRREEQRWRRGLVGLQSKVRTGLGFRPLRSVTR